MNDIPRINVLRKDAYRLAKRALIACNSPLGFIAGTHHFVDLWARDGLFATLGANKYGLSAASKKTIETFLSFQRADGLVPYLILRSRMTIGKYFNRHSFYQTPIARFRSNQSGGIVPDGGLLAVIAATDYVRTKSDRVFARKQYGSLVRAFAWYPRKFGNGLIREWFLCEWADAVLKVGCTLYTNMLYWKAAQEMMYLARLLKRSDDVIYYESIANRLYEVIQKKFWNGLFFADWIDYARHDYIATHANMMAIVWGLATKQQAHIILTYARTYCWNGWTLESNYPRYEWWRIPLLQRVAGMADYHNRGCMWLQPGIWYAMALHSVKQSALAKEVMDVIAKKIVDAGEVYEVFEKNGLPVARRLYRSEGPFAWTAGLFLKAAHTIF
jgi:glycogen debranching enzyme